MSDVEYIQKNPTIIRNGNTLRFRGHRFRIGFGKFKLCLPRLDFTFQKRNGQLQIRETEGGLPILPNALDIDLSIDGNYVIGGNRFIDGAYAMLIGNGNITITGGKISFLFPNITLTAGNIIRVYYSQVFNETTIVDPTPTIQVNKNTIYTYLGQYSNNGGTYIYNIQNLVREKTGLNIDKLLNIIVTPFSYNPNSISPLITTVFIDDFTIEVRLPSGADYTLIAVSNVQSGTNLSDEMLVTNYNISKSELSSSNVQTIIFDSNRVNEIIGIMYCFTNSTNYNTAANSQPIVLYSSQPSIVLQCVSGTSLNSNDSLQMTLFYRSGPGYVPTGNIYYNEIVNQTVKPSKGASRVVLNLPNVGITSGGVNNIIQVFKGLKDYTDPFVTPQINQTQYAIILASTVFTFQLNSRYLFTSSDGNLTSGTSLDLPTNVSPPIYVPVPFPNGSSIRFIANGVTYYLSYTRDPITGTNVPIFSQLNTAWSLFPNILGQLTTTGTGIVPQKDIGNGIFFQDDWFYDGYSLYSPPQSGSTLIYQLSAYFPNVGLGPSVTTIAVPITNIGTGINQQLIIS